MNKAKEEAWIWLFLGVSGFLIPSGVAIFIAYDKGMSFVPLFMLTGTAIWGGLFWLFPFITNKIRKEKKKVSFDERDQLIHKRAVMAAYVVLWLYFVAACVIPWWTIGPYGSISVNVMPMILMGGLSIFLFVQSLATLIQYGWGDNDNE
jgi:hypothetical protein